MTEPAAGTPSASAVEPPRRSRFPAWLIPSVITLLLALFVMRQCAPLRRAILDQNRTSISHSSVIEKIEAVTKLVSSESTIRDVVVIENRRYGSTKRALVVVTGKVYVGFDLKGAKVDIDHDERRIRIELPPASIIATDVTDMKTYDESRGLWNPFVASDRDAIYREARSHLLRAALGMGAKEHANQSAKQLLSALFTTDGYKTEVVTAGGPMLDPRPAESSGMATP